MIIIITTVFNYLLFIYLLNYYIIYYLCDDLLKTETLNWPSVGSNEKSFGNCHNALRSAVIIIITTVFNYLLFIFLTKEPLGVRIPQNKGYQYVVELN